MPMLTDLLLRTVDGAFAIDSTQQIVFWNTQCEQLLGIGAREALGRSCCTVLRGSTAAGTAVCQPGCSYAGLAHGGTAPRPFSIQVRHATGMRRLGVNIVLIPSAHRNQWLVMHLLCRDRNPGALNDTARPRNGARVPESEASTLLTGREQESLRLLAEGQAAVVIAQRLCISPVTVRNHIQHLMDKLDLHSQVEAVAYAYRHNMV